MRWEREHSALTCTSCGKKNATSSGSHPSSERVTYASTAGWRAAGLLVRLIACSSGCGAQVARCTSEGALAAAAAGVASSVAASSSISCCGWCSCCCWGGERQLGSSTPPPCCLAPRAVLGGDWRGGEGCPPGDPCAIRSESVGCLTSRCCCCCCCSSSPAGCSSSRCSSPLPPPPAAARSPPASAAAAACEPGGGRSIWMASVNCQSVAAQMSMAT